MFGRWPVLLLLTFGCIVAIPCEFAAAQSIATKVAPQAIKPSVITQKVKHDTDDPAIWINHEKPEESLVLGTDKDADGAIYAFDLRGKVVARIEDMRRPNNVDIEYRYRLGDDLVDIAVVTERHENRLRVFRLPDLQPIDDGGIEVFVGETGEDFRAPMGIAIYRRSSDGSVFAIVGRKSGPTDGSYLWQYELVDDGDGVVRGKLVRKFGKFSGRGEIEAVMADDSLGYVYYSDEAVGIRKYYADPSRGDEQLAVFGTDGFMEDREGIALIATGPTSGHILVSDQQANLFHVFTRCGSKSQPHQHSRIGVVRLSTVESDGCDATSVSLGGRDSAFSSGLFVAMSDDQTFHFYAWQNIADALGIKR
ncbi:MAG TPA: 3-phytase [Planctomycetaceae bacterium]|nr:3-phytase [Planctomycetaceae bacterium]